jgi:cobaltochelatase CobN
LSDEPVLTLLSTSDTDLLSARASGAGWRLGNPARLDEAGIAALADGSALVVVRILGVRRQYE